MVKITLENKVEKGGGKAKKNWPKPAENILIVFVQSLANIHLYLGRCR